MKKFKLLALAFVIATTSLFATNVEVPDVPVKQISNQVSELFITHDFNLNKDISVNVTFKFGSQGEIIVLNIDSKKWDVINYVNKNMNHKLIATPGEINRVFTVPLKFTKYLKK